MNVANNYRMTKTKLPTALKTVQEALSIMKSSKMRLDGVHLLTAGIYKQLRNTKEADASMQKVVEPSYESEIINAQLQFDKQVSMSNSINLLYIAIQTVLSLLYGISSLTKA
jgi:hypothetical protein